METETSFNITLFYFFSKTKALKKSVYNYLIIFCFTLFYTSVFYPRNSFGARLFFHAEIRQRSPSLSIILRG